MCTTSMYGILTNHGGRLRGVVVGQRDTRLAERVKYQMREVLERHGITHSTIECEYGTVSDECCAGEVVTPH